MNDVGISLGYFGFSLIVLLLYFAIFSILSFEIYSHFYCNFHGNFDDRFIIVVVYRLM